MKFKDYVKAGIGLSIGWVLGTTFVDFVAKAGLKALTKTDDSAEKDEKTNEE